MRSTDVIATALASLTCLGLACCSKANPPETAQTSPRGYIVAEIDVTNPGPYRTYVEKVTPVVAQYHGKYVTRGGKTVALEGDPPKGRVVILEFPSLAEAQTFFHSPQYQAIVPLRHANATARVFVVEGPKP